MEHITLIGLPAYTTRLLCPLDRTVFGPFKKLYAICDDFTSSSPCNLGMKAQIQAFTSKNIKSGFRACGIFPFNPAAIPVEAFLPAEPDRQTGLPTPPHFYTT